MLHLSEKLIQNEENSQIKIGNYKREANIEGLWMWSPLQKSRFQSAVDISESIYGNYARITLRLIYFKTFMTPIETDPI